MKRITKILEDSDIIVTSKVEPKFVDDVIKFLDYLEEKWNINTQFYHENTIVFSWYFCLI